MSHCLPYFGLPYRDQTNVKHKIKKKKEYKCISDDLCGKNCKKILKGEEKEDED